jgi:predicted DNA-binding protein
MSNKLKGISVRCEPEFWERFKKMAKADGRTAASMMLKVMKEAVARYEQSAT